MRRDREGGDEQCRELRPGLAGGGVDQASENGGWRREAVIRDPEGLAVTGG